MFIVNNIVFLKRSLMILIIIGAFSCSDDDTSFTGIPEGEEEEEIEESDFDGPTYSDDYTSMTSWAERSSWNLANVHDPSITKDGDYFYMYQTDASYGNAHAGNGHFPYRRSTDLVNWDFQGMAFQEVPSWVKDSLNSLRAQMDPPLDPIENPNYGFWAPEIAEVNGTYRLYYSIVVHNPIIGNDNTEYWTERAFIGLAETNDLSSNQWEDKGMVVSSVPDGRETYTRNGGGDWSGYFKFNAIDPSFIETPDGEQYLIYGSWHSGISLLKLDPTTGKPTELNSLEDYGTRIAGRGDVNNNRWQGLEAPEIIYNEETGYYYLFLAYDELSVAYNTRVARSENIEGPYYGINGGNVSNGAEAFPVLTHPYKFDNQPGWVGISHCTVFKDEALGKWFYSSQGRLPEGVPGINASNAVMMGQVREIYWTADGWPVVAPERYAAVPDEPINEEDLLGNWEQITLQYEYRTMQTSVDIVLNENNTLGGALSGSWSFDESAQILQINGNNFIIDKAWDWEASTRRTTITYAGISNNGYSIWGKKS